MTAYLDNWLWVPKQYLNVPGTKQALSIEINDREGPRTVDMWKETPTHLLMPRAFWSPAELPYKAIDMRPTSYKEVDIRSNIKLDHRPQVVNGVDTLMPTGGDVQQKSLDALLKSYGGILQLACGKGKTCIALHLASTLKVPTLIIVPDTQLLEQWRCEIEKLLVVPDGVGLMQASTLDWHKPIVLATYHTIGARAAGLPEEIRRWFGLIIWDEGHHIPAPTFAASAEAFYGTRIALTATPERADGLHIISSYHIGPILYKDLTQDLKPMIFFKWTGLTLDDEADKVVRASNNEIHLGLLSSYYGRWLERVRYILDDVQEAARQGRKILVISNSVDEIINLATIWSAGDWYQKVPSSMGNLYSDISEPTFAEVGAPTMIDENGTEVYVQPMYIPRAQATEMKKRLEQIKLDLVNPQYTGILNELNSEKASLLMVLEQLKSHRLLTSEMNKRQKAYVQNLLKNLRNCGFMIYNVKASTRKKFIEEEQIVFAIAKYSREGLDSPLLDTVLVSTPFSSKNVLQQVMGRPSRGHVKKKPPVVVFYEDNIGPIMGMCNKLRKHLRGWSHEEGGPFDYELVDHPKTKRKQWTPLMIFG